MLRYGWSRLCVSPRLQQGAWTYLGQGPLSVAFYYSIQRHYATKFGSYVVILAESEGDLSSWRVIA